MGKTKFQPSLVNEFPWVALLKGDTSKVYCTICKNAFRIDGSGKPQVFSHHKSHSIKDDGKNTKRKPAIDPSQQVFQPTLDGKIGMSEKTSLPPNHADYMLLNEITLLLPHKETQDLVLCFQIVQLLLFMPRQILKLGTIFNLALPHTIKNNLYMMTRDFTFKLNENINKLDDK